MKLPWWNKFIKIFKTMEVSLNYIGADMAMETFVISQRNKSKKGYGLSTIANTDEGIQSWVDQLDPERTCVVMEATGVYHLRLAYTLCEYGIRTCVCNPLSVRRFAEMKGITAKTDPMDAVCLMEYGEQNKPSFFNVPSATLDELRQRRSLLGQLQKRQQMSKNNLHHVEQHPRADPFVKELLLDEISQLEQKIRLIKEKIAEVIDQDYGDQLNLLKSIPGIGDVVASAIIDAANSFQGFDDCDVKAFVKHAGLCPNVRRSGKSVRGASTITRSGTPDLRAKMYLPALTLCTRMKGENPFKQLYTRLIAKGKTFKQTMVAVMHKLLRVAVAVLKSKEPFSLQKHGVPKFAK